MDMAEKKEVSVSITPADSPHALDGRERTVAAEPILVSWPEDSHTLKEGRFRRLCMDLYDYGLIATVILLMLKTTACIVDYKWQQRHPEASGWIKQAFLLSAKALTQLNEQLVTLLTVIYVVIISTAVRRYALYKAERGAYVSDLEQLHGSISMTSTAKLVWTLRKFDKLSAFLLLVWSFYYLGSQACKREYAYVLSDSLHHINAAYPSTNPHTYFDPDHIGNLGEYVPILNSLFRAAEPAMAPSPSGLDLQGFTLIPNMGDELRPNGMYIPGVPIPVFDPDKLFYTSQVGWPLLISASDAGHNPDYGWTAPKILGSYSLEAAYFQFHCGNLEFGRIEDFPTGVMDKMYVSMNTTSITNTTNTTFAEPTAVNIWRRWNKNEAAWAPGPVDPIAFTPISDSGAAKVTCNITRPHVRVSIRCSEISCLPTSVTFLPIDQATLYRTLFDDKRVAEAFFSALLTSFGISDVYNGDTDFDGNFDPTEDLESSDPPYRSFDHYSRTISEYINTYYDAALTVESGQDPMHDPGFQIVQIKKGALYQPHYALSVPWIIIDYTTSLVLLVATIFSSWLRKRTIAPDILGFVSSLTRDAANPHMTLPMGGSTLSGLDRARYMKNVKIKIGDLARDTEDVGVIGVARVHDGARVGHLQKARKYA